MLSFVTEIFWMNKKRCLLVRCKDIVMEDIIWGIIETGHDCDCLDISCNTLDCDENSVLSIKEYIGSHPKDIVLSMNFSPTISLACRELSIPYASWIYDCPIQSLYNGNAYNELCDQMARGEYNKILNSLPQNSQKSKKKRTKKK